MFSLEFLIGEVGPLILMLKGLEIIGRFSVLGVGNKEKSEE